MNMMKNIGTLQARLIIGGGALLMIFVFKGYVELRNTSSSLPSPEGKHMTSISRALSQNGTAQHQSFDDKIYYPHIPELNTDMKLSRSVISTAAVNRDIRNSDNDAPWIRTLLEKAGGTTLEENRLLYKMHESAYAAVHNISGKGCVIRVLQLCRKMCIDLMAFKDNADPKWTMKCKFSNCRIESKVVGDGLADLYQSDVVIFHIDERDWEPLIKLRVPGQLWVFHSKEAPIHGPKASTPREFGNPFNISISYMTDADIAPAYYYLDTAQAEIQPKVRRKDKLMSWVASNCNFTSWKRTQFVQDLQKHLKIDTYGRCGRLDCPRSETECWEMRGDYKFYLALENSQCPEYITEKFWHNSLAVGTVPIVFGAPKADYERIAPPHSFIHLDDFKTVQEFVDFINLLDRNDEMYLQYYSWRRLGHVMKGSSILTNRLQGKRTLCYVVKTLILKSFYPEDYPWQAKHPNFYDWWYGMCREDTQKRRVLDIDV